VGRKKKLAADGTPLARDPKQDAQGNWYCPACGRASGFKNKMAVLGHLRACRPGRPNLGELLVMEPPEVPSMKVPTIYLPTKTESAQIVSLNDVVVKLDHVLAQQASMAKTQNHHSRLLGNHLGHIGLANAQSPAEESSFDVATILKWGGVVLLGVLILRELFPSRGSVALAGVPVGERRSSILDGLKDGLTKKLTANVSSRIARELLPG